MPYQEFLGWFAYFKARPVGWREDNRTAFLLNAQGVKKKPHELFTSLATMRNYSSQKPKPIDPNFLKLLQKAKQGDEWKPEIKD